MRKLADGLALIGIWLGVAGAVTGFFLPWASLDVKYRDVSGRVGGIVRDLPLGDVAGRLTKKIGRIVVTVKKGAETVTGELPDFSKIPSRVNGPQIPQLVNRKDAQVVVALTEMFTGQQDVGAKSYAVYALPVLAGLFGLLLTVLGGVRLASAAIGLASLVFGVGMLWKLTTTRTDTVLITLIIEHGLWVIAWAYVALGFFALARLLTSDRRPD